MSVYGGPYKDLEEWEDISRIVTALQTGELMPVTRTLIAEWRELALALAALSPLSPGGGIGSGGGYGVGPFGTVPWDVIVAPAGAYTVLSQGVKIPNIATVGWGKEINDTFFTPLNTLLDRLTALGV